MKANNGWPKENSYIVNEVIIKTPIGVSQGNHCVTWLCPFGLMEHFGVQLTLDLLDKHLFWPHMKHNVNKFCENCIVCKKSKSKVKCNDPPRRHDIITQKRKKILDF